ncbi:hypothetical protein [Brevibacillus brevis]|uniref:NADPH-dependent reductive aminase-like C-terminal domain-containing protein n=1 Tax=Brevibacillus brevis TaxID=1393 RepID=A0ABY9T586_BREBE|nr:hypothetical protein [Brevibacillus brevis]WNC13558.1 hypothetical protein RGB73_23120 [Brevibacillus brevis]
MEHVIQALKNNGIDVSVLSVAKAIAQLAIDAGYGNEGFPRQAELLRTTPM